MRGELAIVLHTHMPYVEGGMSWPDGGIAGDTDRLMSYLRHPGGFGTWPFGEEWLWEAIATSYLPLLDVLDAAPPGAVTLSVTPVLADQLEHPGAIERCLQFLRIVRPESHRRDVAATRDPALIAELQRSAAEYAGAARRLAARERGGGLLRALGVHAAWTSAASHAVLPLLCTERGVALQAWTGIASHRRRFGSWAGGFWLPECAHASWLDPLLAEAGVRGGCVELTARFGRGNPRHLRPLRSRSGPVLWPIDRATIDLVWGREGYPRRGVYRDYHRHTTHRHRAWAIDGRPYDHGAALAQAERDAADFVARVRERVAGGGVCVCALDTELLGHWWYEGVAWLAGVLREAQRQSLPLTTLDDAAHRHAPGPAPARVEVQTTSWGEGEDLRTWSGPDVAELAWPLRTAELELAARREAPGPRALRELLGLQASDWAFLAHRRLAGDYPRERIRGHLAALHAALQAPDRVDPRLRGLAPDLAGWG
ncbi:MAG: DUF1957 domain-containing protein [Solirubrobacterales bacterium]|nr:DUF1957 domain-containing protein [Solirubrobacterales bacterium]